MVALTRRWLLILIAASVPLALGLVACGGGNGSGGSSAFAHVSAVGTDTCGDVEYGGHGDPTALIVSDLPQQGDSAERTSQMNDAIRQELGNEGWKAGKTDVAFQACDDSIKSTGEWDEATCKSNAAAYAANSDVLGVIGTYNSGCAALMIPILNRAPGGGLPMVSPGNTLICLTETAKGCEPGQPDSLYPSGTRNYARVVPNDAFQGAALATFVQKQGVAKPFLLTAADDPTSSGQANTFTGAAKALGMKLAGSEQWDPKATDYTALMKKVKASGADAVVLAGLLEQNGAQLIKDKVAALGPNQGDKAAAQLFAFDGFAQQATIDDAGPAAAGMFASLPGRLPEKLTGEGKAFVDQLQSKLGGQPIELFAPYAGEAAQVMLSAIAPDPARASIVKGLTQVEIDKGVTGVFTITATGDPSVAPISISVAGDTFKAAAEITPPANLVNAARGG
ncbi:MAG: branched-chain amino acid transport system substrate-binding protein [Solirubrobacterales bacterium]|nr:branched-chain amino acid transport system substrate-binding protein [Solirubrobacterales bacterium]